MIRNGTDISLHFTQFLAQNGILHKCYIFHRSPTAGKYKWNSFMFITFSTSKLVFYPWNQPTLHLILDGKWEEIWAWLVVVLKDSDWNEHLIYVTFPGKNWLKSRTGMEQPSVNTPRRTRHAEKIGVSSFKFISFTRPQTDRMK